MFYLFLAVNIIWFVIPKIDSSYYLLLSFDCFLLTVFVCFNELQWTYFLLFVGYLMFCVYKYYINELMQNFNYYLYRLKNGSKRYRLKCKHVVCLDRFMNDEHLLIRHLFKIDKEFYQYVSVLLMVFAMPLNISVTYGLFFEPFNIQTICILCTMSTFSCGLMTIFILFMAVTEPRIYESGKGIVRLQYFMRGQNVLVRKMKFDQYYGYMTSGPAFTCHIAGWKQATYSTLAEV